MGEQVFNIAVGVFLAAMLFVSATFRNDSVDGDLLKSSGFPALLIIIGIIILAVIIIIQFRKKEYSKIKIIDFSTGSGKTIVLNIVLFTAYISLLNITGYILTTFLYSLSAARSMGYKKNLLLLLYSSIVTAIFVILFGKLFYVPLPRGIGFLRELSYFIY